jgi:Photosynthesis system II assembly factor YCF48
MEELPKIVRARLNAALAGDHPDPDLLAAFTEQALSDRERSVVLSHLARCADCRDILALATPALETASPSIDTAIDTARRGFWFKWSALRWGAVAACVVIVGSAVLMKRDLMMTRSVQMASVRSDAPATYAKEAAPEPPAIPSGQQIRPQASVSTVEEANDELTVSTRIKGEDKKEALKTQQVLMQPMVALPASKPITADFHKNLTAARAGAAGAGIGGDAAQAWQTAPLPATEAAKELPLEGRNVAALPAVPSTSETVEVQAVAPALETDSASAADSQKRESLGKAKPPSGTVFDAMIAPPAAVSGSETVSAKELARKSSRGPSSSYLAPVSRWTISSDGQLQHSVDSGRTWQPVVVADNATFRALSANGPDLWVGGASGLLYHSTDAGGHWAQIKPVATDAKLTADIAAIEFTDVQHGKITTSTGDVWLTDDAGQTWRKQP